MAQGHGVTAVARAPEKRALLEREGAGNLAATAVESGVGRLVQESFAPIYEDGGEQWIDESWPSKPVRYNNHDDAATAVAAHLQSQVPAAGRMGAAVSQRA